MVKLAVFTKNSNDAEKVQNRASLLPRNYTTR